WGIAAALCALVFVTSAQSEDLLSTLFGGYDSGQSRAPSMRLPFANPFAPQYDAPRPRRSYSGGGQAYCVRTCDGRYFPIPASDRQSRTASCSNFCPASETKVVYGSNIDDAATDSGKPYSELPNAFRYRSELVAGCTCNGNDQ